MLNFIKNNVSKRELLHGNYGLEREGLRVLEDGKLSKTLHPEIFGFKICNPYITTDFSESQFEFITPVFNKAKNAHDFLESLYDIACLEINNEYIWPQSMPCILPKDDEIPIANFCECEKGENARRYREKLYKKYGGKKQLISGIHYNFSFNEDLIKKLYEKFGEDKCYNNFKNDLYLKVSRNYLRYKWILVYLFCGSPLYHESFKENNLGESKNNTSRIHFNSEAISYRNGDFGYKNNVDLFPNYNSVSEYVKSINSFVENGYIENHKELYSQIRLKAKDIDNFLNSLEHDGIKYLEYRSLDLNPFEKSGVALNDLEFLEIFNIYLLLKEENYNKNWQQEALYNRKMIANHGLKDINLIKDGFEVDKKEWAIEILNEIKNINKELNLDKNIVIEEMIQRSVDINKSYAYRFLHLVKEKGFVNFNIELAKSYKESSYNNRFKLKGFEDLELSTQILMKESIKRGIKTEVIDRSENFISLKKCFKKEYVKQATKTSKDTYSSVLVMENKVVTKKVLSENNINVPSGYEFDYLEDAILEIPKFINKPIVIKPKSTNFGIGISIFPEGANKEDIIESFKIAFNNDKTILVEEFVKGKEYRFLVIDDEVCGILHRVPANVIGDNEKTIAQLVEIKNENPLRGRGYKTPLEKINLDKNAELFLKQKGLDFEYIPKKDEIVYLRENSNISTGGDSIDYTDDIPDKFKKIAIEATKSVKARICGVDMMIEDYSNENSNYAIIELNFNPAIHIHSYPYIGKERKIAEKVLKVLDLI